VANRPSAAFRYSDADCVPIDWRLLKANNDAESAEDEQNVSCFYFAIFATVGKTYLDLQCGIRSGTGIEGNWCGNLTSRQVRYRKSNDDFLFVILV
jgi:hypothetical protein